MKKKSDTAKLFNLAQIFLGWVFLISLFTLIIVLYKGINKEIDLISCIIFTLLCLLMCVYSVFLIRAFDKAEKEQDKLNERLENIENKLNNETKENL